MGQFFLQDYVYYTIFVCYNKANECKRIKFVIRNVVLVIEPVNTYTMPTLATAEQLM